MAATADNWVFGCLENGKLIGVVRLVRDPGKKERHKASIFGMVVASNRRRKGIGRKLLEVAIGAAKELKGVRQLHLTVTATNPGAITLYRQAGFVEYGRERDALLVAGKFHAELLMAKRL